MKTANLTKMASWACLALLAGCGSLPPAPQIVNVPVYTSCVKEVPLKPDYEFGKMSLTDSEGDKVLALARDWPRGRKYPCGRQQLSVPVSSCSRLSQIRLLPIFALSCRGRGVTGSAHVLRAGSPPKRFG